MISFEEVTLSKYISEEAIDWRNDKRIWKWCRQNTLISPQDQENWLNKIQSDPSILMFGIDAFNTGVGVCGLTSIDWMNRKAEFSLYIAPRHQRQGLGKMALKALIGHGFLDLGLNRIWGETFQGNPAIRMFKDIGMTDEGFHKDTYFKNGRFISSHTVAITRNEYDRICST